MKEQNSSEKCGTELTFEDMEGLINLYQQLRRRADSQGQMFILFGVGLACTSIGLVLHCLAHGMGW